MKKQAVAIHAAVVLYRDARLVCLFAAAKPAQKDCTVVRSLAFGDTGAATFYYIISG
ncbi:MAG: hypothetical protein II969_04525 [Anaerolineaceae bacterium]|nr:hypothetical protein [Anaerolineaceae bacterium]